MLSLYRGHWIIRFRERGWVCEITERASAAVLPTTASATLDEGPEVCLDRAKALVDRYNGTPLRSPPPKRRTGETKLPAPRDAVQ